MSSIERAICQLYSRRTFAFVLLAVLLTLQPLQDVALAHGAESTGATTNTPDTSRLAGNLPWIVLLCKFADIADETYSPLQLRLLMSDEPIGLDSYWQEVSYGAINITNSHVVDRWYSLSKPRSYYVQPLPSGLQVKMDELIDDCYLAAGAGIALSDYYGIHIVLNADLDPSRQDRVITEGGRRLFAGTDLGYTLLSPLSFTNLQLVARNMSNAFGLPKYSSTDDNPWDLLTGPRYVHLNAYHKDLMGFIPPAKKVVVHANSRARISIEDVNQPQTDDPLLVVIPIAGATEHFYTLEVRGQTGHDWIWVEGAKAVVIHEVDSQQELPVQVVDADAGRPFLDEGLLWRTGEVYNDSEHQIVISVLEETEIGFIVEVTSGTPPNPDDFSEFLYLPNVKGSD